jgi:hypothetical protein
MPLLILLASPSSTLVYPAYVSPLGLSDSVRTVMLRSQDDQSYNPSKSLKTRNQIRITLLPGGRAEGYTAAG